MYKLKTALYQFNRPVFALNIVLSLYLVYCRNIYSYPLGLFAKCCGYLVIIGYQYFSANKSFFYFRNAGYSIKQLYTYSFVVDLLLFSILYLIPAIIYECIHAKG